MIARHGVPAPARLESRVQDVDEPVSRPDPRAQRVICRALRIEDRARSPAGCRLPDPSNDRSGHQWLRLVRAHSVPQRAQPSDLCLPVRLQPHWRVAEPRRRQRRTAFPGPSPPLTRTELRHRVQLGDTKSDVLRVAVRGQLHLRAGRTPARTRALHAVRRRSDFPRRSPDTAATNFARIPPGSPKADPRGSRSAAPTRDERP